MTFRELYQKLRKQERPLHPAKAFVLRIAAETGRSPRTVIQWISGIQQPPKSLCVYIGQILEMDPDDLFPNMEKESIKQ